MVVLFTIVQVLFIAFSIYMINITPDKFKIFFHSVLICLHFIGIARNTIHYWNI